MRLVLERHDEQKWLNGWACAVEEDLEDAGLVEHAGPEYHLTARGEDLRPVLEELSMWASAHDAWPPRPDETVIPEHEMWALEHRVRAAPFSE